MMYVRVFSLQTMQRRVYPKDGGKATAPILMEYARDAILFDDLRAHARQQQS
jgi:hypothetical protein